MLRNHTVNITKNETLRKIPGIFPGDEQRNMNVSVVMKIVGALGTLKKILRVSIG